MKELDILRPVMRPIIKNLEAVVCKKCVYFREHRSTNICTKFGEKNIITGTIQYQYCSAIRADSDLCGKRGLYYIRK